MTMPEIKSDTLKVSKLLKIFSGSLIFRILYILFSFINSILLAKVLGPSEYGVYILALSFVSMLSIPTQFGMPMLVTREFAAFQALHQWNLMKGLAIRSHQFTLIVSLIVCTSALLWLWINPNNYSESKQQALMVSLCLVPILSLGALRDSMLRGLRHVILSLLSDSIIRPFLFMLCLLAMIFLVQTEISSKEVIKYYIICSIIAFVIGWILFNNYQPKDLKSANSSFNSKSWLLSAFPIGMTSAMQILNNEFNIIYLGFLSLDKEIAFFRIAVLLSTTMFIFMQVTESFIAPYFSRLYYQEKLHEIERLIKKLSLICSLLTIPIFILFVLYGNWILVKFYGTSYIAAYYPLLILSFGQLINVFIGPVALLLIMTGQQNIVTYTTVCSLSINIVLQILLVPTYGIIGSAIASSTSLILWNIILLFQVKRKLSISYLI